MIGFPRDSIQRNLPQKLYHILTTIVMRLSLLILTHKDNRHIGKIWPDSLPKSSGSHCILCHLWLYHHNGKGHPLLNNHRTMYNHRLTVTENLQKAIIILKITFSFHSSLLPHQRYFASVFVAASSRLLTFDIMLQRLKLPTNEPVHICIDFSSVNLQILIT